MRLRKKKVSCCREELLNIFSVHQRTMNFRYQIFFVYLEIFSSGRETQKNRLVVIFAKFIQELKSYSS